MRRRCLGGALSNVLDFPQNASHICDVFVCVPYIRSSWCSTVKTMFAQDDSGSIFDVPLACWIQLCFVRLLKNKMTVITSETIVLYFNLIAHWQSYTQKRIMNFEKKNVSDAYLNIEKRGSSQACSFHRYKKTRRVAVLSVLYTFTKI